MQRDRVAAGVHALRAVHRVRWRLAGGRRTRRHAAGAQDLPGTPPPSPRQPATLSAAEQRFCVTVVRNGPTLTATGEGAGRSGALGPLAKLRREAAAAPPPADRTAR